MDYYKKITRLQGNDKHVLHNYKAEFYEFSPELIKEKTTIVDSLIDTKEKPSYFVRRKISL